MVAFACGASAAWTRPLQEKTGLKSCGRASSQLKRAMRSDGALKDVRIEPSVNAASKPAAFTCSSTRVE